MRSINRILILPLLLAGLSLAPSPVRAQEGPPEVKNVITFNPFLAAFGWYTGEFERVLTPKFSVAASGSFVELGSDEDFDTVTYAGADATLRLYPQERGPSGLFFGVSLGVRSIEDEFGDTNIGPDGPEARSESTTLTAAGFEIGFTYLFGVKQNYVLSVGAGVVKFFGGDDLDNVTATLPTIRLVNLGFAF